MKTFKKLTVGDIFYTVSTDYKGKENPNFSELEVKSIEIEEKDGEPHLAINKVTGTYGSSGYVFAMDKCDNNIIQNGNNGYYTTEYSQLVILLKEAGLKYIRDINAAIRCKEKEIEQVRRTYWDYLNNLVKEPVLEKATEK